MKIALSEQIIEAELHRDELEVLIAADAKGQAELHRRRDRVEGTILTLRLIQATEEPFREFMTEYSAAEKRRRDRRAASHQPQIEGE